MPINIPDHFPAAGVLEKENIFVMYDSRAYHQDIRPLRILLMNLMPLKIVTETQFLRLLSNTPLQVDIDFMCTSTYRPQHTSQDHLIKFYASFDDLKDNYYDGMIITGAPVEQMPFEDVAYWDELCRIMEWSKTHVYSTLHVCWGAQAGLYYHYGIPKYALEKKMFGVFAHERFSAKQYRLLRGVDDVFYLPHSRHTEVRLDDILRDERLNVLACSEEAGVGIVKNRSGRHVFFTGHGEYDADTLKKEYDRDVSQGLPIEIPHNYYPKNDPSRAPRVLWRSTSNVLFSNWLNMVYQDTPYDLTALTDEGI